MQHRQSQLVINARVAFFNIPSIKLAFIVKVFKVYFMPNTRSDQPDAIIGVTFILAIFLAMRYVYGFYHGTFGADHQSHIREEYQ